MFNIDNQICFFMSSLTSVVCSLVYYCFTIAFHCFSLHVPLLIGRQTCLLTTPNHARRTLPGERRAEERRGEERRGEERRGEERDRARDTER